MIVQPSEVFQVIWIGWVISWVAASLWSGRTQKRDTTYETWIYRAVIFVGAILIAPWTAQMLGEKPTWQVGNYGAYAIVGVMLLGLALTWWARIELGHLWSSAITYKEKHRLVDTGPYALVRHPIYTGIVIAAGGDSSHRGDDRGAFRCNIHNHRLVGESPCRGALSLG